MDSLSSRCFFNSSIQFRPFISPSTIPFRQRFFHSVRFTQSPFKSFSSGLFAASRSFFFASVLLPNLLPLVLLAFEFRDIAVSPTSTQSAFLLLLLLLLAFEFQRHLRIADIDTIRYQ
ncbi:hypothetical protein QL285_008672 [Trifolium repens]|nr:hypothetical protein QL285_008672 [Trifolium repens]